MTNLLQSVLNWLEKGYPQGVPATDYIPLLEVLHRKLTEAEVNQVVESLATKDATITREAISDAIEKRVLEDPSDEDIARVASKLAAGGWPLSGLRKVREQVEDQVAS